jgi:uncharacterized iron-regulated protein
MWLKTRKKLYERVRAQVEDRLGEQSAEFRRYEREYEREFDKKWRMSSKKQLADALAGARMIMLGDFHALMQSQKSQLRIFKSLPQNASVVLAVECIESRYQKDLDLLWLGRSPRKLSW